MGWLFELVLKTKGNLPSPTTICSSVLENRKGEADYEVRLQKLREFVAAYEKGAKNVVEKTKEIIREQKPDANLQVRFLESPAKLQPKADYVANDCFHLSLDGQEALARLIEDEIRAKR